MDRKRAFVPFVIGVLLGLAEFLGEPDEQPSRAANVAKSVHVLVIDDFTDELHAAQAEPFERRVEVVNGEHDAKIAQSIDRRFAVV